MIMGFEMAPRQSAAIRAGGQDPAQFNTPESRAGFLAIQDVVQSSGILERQKKAQRGSAQITSKAKTSKARRMPSQIKAVRPGLATPDSLGG